MKVSRALDLKLPASRPNDDVELPWRWTDTALLSLGGPR